MTSSHRMIVIRYFLPLRGIPAKGGMLFVWANETASWK